MRKLAVLTFVTLDGVMQAPSDPAEDRSGGFNSGGWARECWTEVMEQVSRESMADQYDLLLGRNTYDVFATHLGSAQASDPVAQRLTAATKFVVSSNPLTVPWDNSIVLSGDVMSAIAELKKSEGHLLQVHGSWQLIQALRAADLVDKYRLWVFPVVVGHGKRLFEGESKPANLQLVKSATTSGGAVMAIYRRVAKP
jgi:dihydrofolate reductase